MACFEFLTLHVCVDKSNIIAENTITMINLQFS